MKNTEQTPPNYQKGDFGRSCGNCKNYDVRNGTCLKYEVRVSGAWVCDSWQPVYK